MSKWFVVTFFDEKNNCISKQEYSIGELQKGIRTGSELKCKSVKFEFELDREIWKESFFWDENYIIHEIKNFAYLYKKIKFIVNYQVDNEKCKTIYYFKKGLKDRLNIEMLNGYGGSFFETEIDKQIDDFHIEMAFAFRNYSVDNSYLSSYVNDQLTYEHGTHVDALLKGLARGIVKYFEKHKLSQVWENLEKELCESLIAVLNIKMKNPRFSGSVKSNLTNNEIVKPIANYIMNIFFEKIENDENSMKKLIHGLKLKRRIKNMRE